MDAPKGSIHHVVDQKNSKVMAAISYQISSAVIMVGTECRLLSAIPNTPAMRVIVVRFPENTSESLTDQTTLFVVMDQVIVHPWGQDPLRIYDAII